LAVPLGIGLLLGCSSDSDGSTQSQMSELEPGAGGPMTGPGDDSSSEDSTADGSGEDEPAFGGDDPTNEDDTPDAGDGPSIDPPCPGCSDEPEAYQPCAFKACGEVCSSCPPDATDCFETLELKTCGADGQCSGVGRLSCDNPSPVPTGCEDGQLYYAAGCGDAPPDIPALVEPGCFAPCGDDDECGAGADCVARWVDLSANCPPGVACLAVCGFQANICVP
jgi:hypothetical protein